MEKPRYITLIKAFNIPTFLVLLRSRAYFPCTRSNNNDCTMLGKDPVTNDLRIGNRNIYGGNWSKLFPEDFDETKIYPGSIILQSTTS